MYTFSQKALYLIVFLLLFIVISCTQHKIEHVEKAFYYWKNNEWNLSNAENESIDSLQLKKLYVKFFEVGYDSGMGIYPFAKTNLRIYSELNNIKIIPCVYLRNDIFYKCSKGAIDTLADNVNFLITKYSEEKFNGISSVEEFQMDCDWTQRTKDNYFYFLKKLKEISKKEISCTLRLYPYKYPQDAGIPPVDKVMLMCYNLLPPLKTPDKNSILDNDELKSYLNTKQKYPLHLDIALPLYSWCLIYQNDRFVKLFYTTQTEINHIAKPLKPLWYEAVKDTVLEDGFYVRMGDRLKFEEITKEQINDAISLLKSTTSFDKNTTVTFFHLDEKQLTLFGHESISSFYSSFSK